MNLRTKHSVLLCCAIAMHVVSLGGCSSLGGGTSDGADGGGARSSSPPKDQVISRPRTSSRNGDDADRRASEPTNRSSSEDTSPLYDSSAEAILESSKFRQRIDLNKIDQELLSAAVFHETNRMREKHGLEPLRHMAALDEAAMLHARGMARDGHLSHENRDSRLRQPIDRVRSVGLEPRFVAENVATAFGIRYESGERVYEIEDGANGKLFSREPNGEPIPNHTYRSFARDLVQGWMNSPGHRKNILYPSSSGEGPTHMGHACVRSTRDDGIPTFYCAQLFFAGH